MFEVFYGGARGGGKTDGMLGEWMRHASLYGEGAIGLMVRRERTQLIETIERSKQVYGKIGAQFHEQDKLWRFPNGARLRFAYLERDSDADAYQGHSYTRVYVEELGTFPSPKPIMKLMATLRSGSGVPVGFRATGNPGGPGHHWVKARYVDPAPHGLTRITSEFVNPFTGENISRDRVYIPSRVTDNPTLGAEYVANLQMSGSPELVRAWLEGDWSVVEGAFFDKWSPAMILRPFAVPNHWTRFRSLDWGYAQPFACYWWALSEGDPIKTADGPVWLPKGALLAYREWYGMVDGQPNIGVRMDAEEVAKGIIERELFENVPWGVADPSMWGTQSGPSPAERMAMYRHPKHPDRFAQWRKADNKRVAEKGALGGWDQMRARMRGVETENGQVPLLYFFSTCTEAIRTIPALQHDPNRAEDVDTDMEDHAADSVRYACMSRPISLVVPAKPKPPHPHSVVRIFEDDVKPRSKYRA